jgi:His-Xaa-Ser system radical SAM maturase HxsB
VSQLDLSAVIRLDRIKPGFAVPFNHRVLNGSIVISNDLGDWDVLAPEELRRFIEGDLRPDEPLYDRLKQRRFIASELDIAEAARVFRGRHHFLAYGPTLHGMVLTERCNHGCQYCHSSVVGMGRTETDMSQEVAERAVDMAFETTSPNLTIEFQGGEPTANWDTLTFIVEHARKKNLVAKKALGFTLVSNLSLMTEERLEYLIDRRVQVCTSLDGPADLHNRIRIFKGGDSHAIATGWIKRINQRYQEIGLDYRLYRVEALPTLTRDSLTRARDLVDQYVSLGCRAIFLRKLDPFGFAAQTSKKLGYSMEAYNAFYGEALDYIIELNLKGTEVLERHAAIILSKMMAGYEPNYLDLRTPGGAAIGQLGYHPDGSVYSSDEGRMVAAGAGDPMFRLGNVLTDRYADIMGSPAVRALILASTNLAQPDCTSCVYRPFCGQQPEYNYKSQGSLFGRMRDSNWCKKHKFIFDTLVTRLQRATPEERQVLERWTTWRTQERFLQPTGAAS